jgi:hypothetical membrane protein
MSATLPLLLLPMVTLASPAPRRASADAGEPKPVERFTIPVAVGILGVSLIAAHALAPGDYSLRTHTISDLGAQGYDHAWVMRTGFLGFGTVLAGTAVWDLGAAKQPWAREVPLMLYGASMSLSGVFSAPPFRDGEGYSQRQADLHQVSAMSAGLSLSAAMLAHAITEDEPAKRWFDVGALVFTGAVSAAFALDAENQGIWQRVLWAGGLSWLTVSATW